MDKARREPLIVRADSPELPTRCQDEIARLIDERARSIADRPLRMLQAQRAALSPLEDLIKQNPDSAKAVEELRAMRSEAVDLGQREQVQFTRDAVHPAQPGLHFFGPPYDFAIDSPTQDPATTHCDKDAGTFGVSHPFGAGVGFKVATAGVSTALRAVQGGFARIAPVVKYNYHWSLRGLALSAFTEGWCELIVQDASGLILPQGQRTVHLWNHTSETSADGDGADQIYVPDIETTVALAEGQVFHVTLLCAAVTVKSGHGLFAWSFAGCEFDSSALFFTVTL